MGKIDLVQPVLVLGVLVVVVLLALNPFEFKAQSRDRGRVAMTGRLGDALEGYAKGNGGVYPEAGSWEEMLVAGEYVNSVPPEAEYRTAGNGAVVFLNLESRQNNRKCAEPQVAWVVYSTFSDRVGTVCEGLGGPSPTPQDFID